jgi:hypothetical protein
MRSALFGSLRSTRSQKNVDLLLRRAVSLKSRTVSKVVTTPHYVTLCTYRTGRLLVLDWPVKWTVIRLIQCNSSVISGIKRSLLNVKLCGCECVCVCVWVCESVGECVYESSWEWVCVCVWLYVWDCGWVWVSVCMSVCMCVRVCGNVCVSVWVSVSVNVSVC